MGLVNGTRHRLPQRVYDIQEREAMEVGVTGADTDDAVLPHPCARRSPEPRIDSAGICGCSDKDALTRSPHLSNTAESTLNPIVQIMQSPRCFLMARTIETTADFSL